MGLATADLDGDGRGDVLCTDADGWLYAFEGATGDPLYATCWAPNGRSGGPADLLLLPGGPDPVGTLVLLGAVSLRAFSASDGVLLWSCDLPRFPERTFEPSWQLVELGDQDGDGLPDVLAGAGSKLGAVVVSSADGTTLRTLQREELVPRPTLGSRYHRGADVDADGVDDFVINLGSYERAPDRNCSYAYSGRDQSLLKRLR